MPTPAPRMDHARLLARLHALGEIGRESRGGRTRLALTDEDRDARDLVVSWMKSAGARVQLDGIGNIFAVIEGRQRGAPVMTGSHIDTVRRAGALDGCYGVVAAIEVLHAVRECRERLDRDVVAAVFTNEEGVRFAPDLLGSRVFAGCMELEAARSARAPDGCTVAEELHRIGYAGEAAPFDSPPAAFIELHIEQGPQLEAARTAIGIVEAVQGHAWWRVTIEGVAGHAGTTPMSVRRDAGAAAMDVATRVMQQSREQQIPNVATVGTIAFEPNAINVVPGRATFTLDLRDHRDEILHRAAHALGEALQRRQAAGFVTSAECISRHDSVRFDPALCDLLSTLAAQLHLPAMRMLSGASHDAQMMARVCPTAMIFVPSRGGISHNPAEHTEPEFLARGAELLLGAVLHLATAVETENEF